MTLAPKTKLINTTSQRHGFTLLELMITLALIAIIAGSSMLYIGTNQNSDLAELRVSTINLVRNARALAANKNQAQYLNLSSTELWIDASAAARDELDHSPPQHSRVTIPANVETYFSLEDSGSWSRLGSNPHRWCIASSGLSETVRIKFQMEDGAQEELEFHPFFSSPLEFIVEDESQP